MLHSLDEYINAIIQNTEKQVSGQKYRPFTPEESRRGYALMTDQKLDTMIPDFPSDILVNAHIAAFDKHVFPHQHTFYELVYTHRGNLRMVIDGREFLFSAGDFVLLNPSVIHQVSFGEPGSQAINILMKRSLFNKTFFYVILENQPFADFLLPPHTKHKKTGNYMIYPKAAAGNPSLQNYLTSFLKEYVEHQYLSSSALEINLCGLCLELTRSGQPPLAGPSPKTNPGFTFSNICQYLTTRLDTANLKDTAKYFHYNPRYFSQLLAKMYGKSFSGLLLELRMAYAAKLLKQTSLPVSEIIRRLGYANTSYFYHSFEQIYDMKPSEYRIAVHENR